MRWTHRSLALTLTTATIVVTGAACADSIAPEGPDAGHAPDAQASSGRVTTSRASDGTFTTVLDATAPDAWVHADLERGIEVDATGPWTLRFQRFHISTNGGVSGSLGVEVAMAPGATFADLRSPPADGWIHDAADDDDPDDLPEYAFEQGEGWYDYDPTTHVLTAKPLIWAVKTAGGATIKLELTRYYDEAGTAGWFTFRWAPL